MNYWWLLLPAAMLALAIAAFWDAPYDDENVNEEGYDSSSGEGE